ncbi:MAG: segregation and condensation protein A [Candidatus Kapaibacteriota bacterium]
MDLLLYFIKRDEINIYDIPIAKITDEFLGYIKQMQELDIEIASEFLVMASTLMEIKAKMLLPVEQKDTTEEQDPRNGLVQQLIEYQIFKEVSQYLETNLEQMQNIFYRGVFETEIPELSTKLKTFKPATVYDLAKAFYEMITRNEDNTVVQSIKTTELKIEDAIVQILDIMKTQKQISFKTLCQNASKPVVVLFFVAILELVKQKLIYAYQNSIDSDIFLFLTSKFQSN